MDTRNSATGLVLVLGLVWLAISAQPVAAGSIAIASENTNETDFQNATSLDNFDIRGSGDDAYLYYTGAGEYLASAWHWNLDDDENPAVDEHYGYEMNFVNSPTYVDGLGTPRALDMDTADSDRITNTEPFDPKTQGEYTLHARAKPDTVSNTGVIMQWDGGIIVRVQSGEMRYYQKDGGGNYQLVASPSISADQTYDVAIVWDGTYVQPYLNGSKVGGQDINGITLHANTDVVAFGHPDVAGTNDFGFDGTIDEPRTWNSSLSDTNISELHDDPKKRFESAATDGTAEYIGQSHNVSGAVDGKVNFSTLDNSTAYVEWQYDDGGTWATHSNTTYTTSGVKSADLTTQTATEWRVKVSVEDSGRNGTVRVDGDWVTFENTAPLVDNSTLTPEGTLEDDTPTMTVNVSDPDFTTTQGDELNATLYVDGRVEGYDTLTSNGTASVGATVSGTSTYYWRVKDSYGGVTESDSVEITSPATLYIFNETRPHDLVDGVDASVTVTGGQETVDLETVESGKVRLGGLPTGENYVFTVNAPGYFPREVYVTDLYEQQSVYLLPESTPSVQNRITITDRTGEYDTGTVVVVDRVIDRGTIEEIDANGTEWTTMGGDRLGTSGFYAIYLEEYARYRFRVINDQGDSRVLGEYTAKSDGTVDLKIGSISYSAGPGDNTYEWDVSKTNVTGGNYSVSFAYNDHEDLTTSLTATVKTRENGTVLGTQTFESGPYGEVVYTLPINNTVWENNDIEVEWQATRDGDTIGASRLVTGTQQMDFPIANMWKTVAYAGGVLILAFLVGAGAGPAPALITVGTFAAFGVYIGLAPAELGFGATILVLSMGAVLTARKAQRPTV